MARRKLFIALALAGTALTGCATSGNSGGGDEPARGLVTTNQPVVSRTDYVFDVAAPEYGGLSTAEAARLDAWFRSLGLDYGDTIYLDDPRGYDPARRAAIAGVTDRYGLLIADGAPVTEGRIADGNIRVIVSRSEAYVPNCPNWGKPSQPNYDGSHDSNFGCAINGNLAAMIANPQDLINGRTLGGPSDPADAVKALTTYRGRIPTGTKELKAEAAGGK